MFTAEEYRTAAKVLKEHPLAKTLTGELAIEGFEAKAEKVEAREKYAGEIGRVASGNDQSFFVRGARILDRLLEDVLDATRVAVLMHPDPYYCSCPECLDATEPEGDY